MEARVSPPSTWRAVVEVAWFTLQQQGILGVVVFALFPLVFAGLLHAERLAIGQIVGSFVETRARIDVDDPKLLERLQADRAAIADRLGSVGGRLVVQRTPDPIPPRIDGSIRVHLPESVLEDGRFAVEGDTVSAEGLRLILASWVASRWADARLGGGAPPVEVEWRNGEPPPDRSLQGPLRAFGQIALGASLLFGMIAGSRAFRHLRSGPGRVMRLLMPYRAVALGVVLASLVSDVGSKVLGWGAGSALLSVWLGGVLAPDASTVSGGALLVPLGAIATVVAMSTWMMSESLVDGVSPRLQALVFGPLSALGLAALIGLTLVLSRWATVLAVLPGVGTLGVWTLFADADWRWIPLLLVQGVWAGVALEGAVRSVRQPGSLLMDALQRRWG
jgi:hypothetical protein